MIDAVIGAIAGSAITAIGLLIDRDRRRSERIAEEAQFKLGLQRDIGHLQRDLRSLGDAIKLIHDELNEERSYIRRIASKVAPEILEELL